MIQHQTTPCIIHRFIVVGWPPPRCWKPLMSPPPQKPFENKSSSAGRWVRHHSGKNGVHTTTTVQKITKITHPNGFISHHLVSKGEKNRFLAGSSHSPHPHCEATGGFRPRNEAKSSNTFSASDASARSAKTARANAGSSVINPSTPVPNIATISPGRFTVQT